MKIDKKIKAAYEALPTPKAEDVLPAAAFREEKRERRLFRPVIYAVATICLCAVIGVALMMRFPGNAPIEETGVGGENIDVITDVTGTNAITEEREEVTTCEEVYAYLNIGNSVQVQMSESSDGTTEIVEPPKPEKVLVKTSDGKVLIVISLAQLYTKQELWARYKEVYGEDYEIYLENDRFEKEVIPKVLGREYREGDYKNEAVIAARQKGFDNIAKLRNEWRKSFVSELLEDIGCDWNDVFRDYYYVAVYVPEKNIDAVENHKYVSWIYMWDEYAEWAFEPVYNQ